MQGPTCICGDALVHGFLVQPDLSCNADCSGFVSPTFMGERYCGGVGGQVSMFSLLRKIFVLHDVFHVIIEYC